MLPHELGSADAAVIRVCAELDAERAACDAALAERDEARARLAELRPLVRAAVSYQTAENFAEHNAAWIAIGNEAEKITPATRRWAHGDDHA